MPPPGAFVIYRVRGCYIRVKHTALTPFAPRLYPHPLSVEQRRGGWRPPPIYHPPRPHWAPRSRQSASCSSLYITCTYKYKLYVYNVCAVYIVYRYKYIDIRIYTRTIPTDTHEGGGRILGNWFCRLLRRRRRHPSKAHAKKNITRIKKEPLKKFLFFTSRQHNIASYYTCALKEGLFRQFKYLWLNNNNIISTTTKKKKKNAYPIRNISY